MEQAVSAPQNPLERRLALSIERVALDKEMESWLKQKGRSAKIPGFRPGKTPLSVLRQQFGKEARHEALSRALQAAFGARAAEERLNIAGMPRIEADDSASSGTHLAFQAVFEVFPEIALGDLSGVTIERPVLEVTEAEVDKALEMLRRQRVRYHAVESGAAKEDRVVVDFFGSKNGEPFPGGEAKDYPFVLGRGMMLPAFEAAVEGMRAGEEKEFDLTFPEDYFSKEMAGQKVAFKVHVKQVTTPSLPEVDAEFARALGIEDGDLVKMRAEVEGNLRREVKKRIEARVQTQVMDALLKVHSIPVPYVLVDAEIRRLMESARQDLAARGMSAQTPMLQPAWFAERAKTRVTLGLIVAEIVKTEKLEASRDQVKALIEEMAETYEKPEEVAAWYQADAERLSSIEALVVERNVAQWVLSRAKVTDAPVAFEELMKSASANAAA
ncbi:MAG: trigger factor [Zoogloeaceae bacterium]|nr:trigger factor [Zoogloeaceae bacterium]